MDDKIKKITILTDFDNHQAAIQFDLLKYKQKLIKKRLGYVFEFVNFSYKGKYNFARNFQSDVITLRPDWSIDISLLTDDVLKIKKNNPNSKIVIFDPFDQTTSRFFPILNEVDLLIKYQIYLDKTLYNQDYLGGTLLTEQLAQQNNIDLADWHCNSLVPDGCLDKIIPGFNYGVIYSMFRKFNLPLWKVIHLKRKRTIDVCCHMLWGSRNEPDSWYRQHRKDILQSVSGLSSNFSKAISGDYIEDKQVDYQQYKADMQKSKIVISPFGWGECTGRDFETILNGSLLVKQNMGHVLTEPNIYIPYETYIPIKWDCSDLEEVCEYYLNNDAERMCIANNAYDVYRSYFSDTHYLDTLRRIFS